MFYKDNVQLYYQVENIFGKMQFYLVCAHICGALGKEATGVKNWF